MKKVLSLVLTIALTLSIIPAGLFSITANAQMTVEFAGGSGTKTDPYLIATANQLGNIRNHLSSHFKITSQLHVGGWTPIGSSNQPFVGTLDGNGYAIVGLTVTGECNTGGLFGCIGSTGVVKNLGIIDGQINIYAYPSFSSHSGTIRAGAIAGYNNGTIENCYNTGPVTVSFNVHSGYLEELRTLSYSLRAGGIAGVNLGTITHCYNTGTIECTTSNGIQNTYYTSGEYSVTANAYGGGIAGDCHQSDGLTSGSVYNSFNKGDVTVNVTSQSFLYSCSGTSNSYTYAGGITGKGSAFRCYNTGTISTRAHSIVHGSVGPFKANSYANAGGVSGFSYGIKNCYNTGTISATSNSSVSNPVSVNNPSSKNTTKSYSFAGGIVGRGVPSHCYNLGSTGASSQPYGSSTSLAQSDYIAADNNGIIGAGTPKTEYCYTQYDALSDPATYIGFDFDTIWEMNPNAAYRYPTLRGLPTEVGDILNFAGGVGTEQNPYKIASKDHLNNVRNDLSAHYSMVENIWFADTDFEVDGKFYNSGKGWQPIGSADAPFTGHFDGNGYSIAGLVANVETYDAETYMGLFGYLDGGIIQHLGMVDSNLQLQCTATDYCGVGGIVGYMASGSVKDCYNNGNVSLGSVGYELAAGGIVGYIAGGTVENCYNIGDVKVSDTDSYSLSGGIVGYISGGNITNCYNAGKIMSQNQGGTHAYTGGIAGYIRTKDGSTATISNCYNKGLINSSAIDCRGYSVAGGIVGKLEEVNDGVVLISASYNTGNLSAVSSIESNTTGSNIYVYSFAGGIVGHALKGTIQNCYNIGSVYSTSNSDLSNVSTAAWNGGILGSGSTSSIKYCYNTGDVFADANVSIYIGGICGYGSLTSTVTKSFYEDNVANSSNKTATDDSRACSLTEMKQQGTYVGFDFDTVWTMGGHTEYFYPELQNVAMDYTKSVQSIELKSMPTKLRFVKGMALDVSGGQITVRYDNDTTQCVELTTDMVSGFDNTALGIQLLTITYEGKTTTYEVEVITRTLLSIDITKTPDQLTYLEGIHILSVSGGQITIFYEGDVSETKDITTEMVTGFDNTYVGKQTLTVTLEDKIDTYEVEIIAQELNHITISKHPNTRHYLECLDTLNVVGGQITAYYSGGFSVVYDIVPSMISGFDNTVVGKQELTVTFENKATTYEVEILAKSLVSIDVTTKPSALEYLEGDEFSKTGMIVTAYYNNNTSAKVNDYTLSGYDSTPGTKIVTVAYQDKTTSFEVEVIAKSLTHIEITTMPNKLTYLEGDAFSREGMIVTAIYNNGTSHEIGEYIVDGYTSTPGRKTITVNYSGKTATFHVEVAAKSLTSIAITTMPNKLTYLEGDLFDPTGMIVTAYYNNETNAAVTDYTISGYDSTPGTKTITVEYNNVSKSFEVVVEAKSLTSIEITKTPTKTEYLEAKDELSVVGGQITLYYNNGTSQTIDMLPSMVSGFDNTIVGVQSLTVTYNEKTATYDIEIVEKNLVSIELIDNGLKKAYIEGQSLDVTGGKIRRYYNNDTYSDIILSRSYVSGFDNTVIGSQQLTITYGGHSAYYNINVIEKTLQSITVSKKPDKITYVDGEEFNATGMVVKANYDNGSSEVILNYTLSGYDPVPGSKTIVVSYEGKTASFTVTVEEKRFAYISVTTKPNKMEYIEGEPFDPTGMVVTAHYYNCEDEIITEYSISGYDSTPSLDLITITYKGKTTNFFVDVKSKSLTSISVTTKPNITTYIESTALDDTGMVLTLYYNNNTSETITTGWVSEYDFSNVGTSAVKVTYGGKTCTYDVMVIAKTLTSIAVESEPNKLEYLEGDANLDTDGLVVRAYYNNDTSEIISGNYTVTGYTSTPGEKTITVTYQGKTATFTINVKAKSVNSISVTQKPNKLTYLEGDSFDKTGMVITAYYNNNTSSAVTDYTISGYTSTVGTKTITVSYGGKTATFTITVKSKIPSSVSSSKYTISGNTIRKITSGTTVSSLLSGLNEGTYCKVYKGNSVISNDTAVGTGMVVKIMDGNTAIAEYTIIVTGDTNGDGNITITDMIAIKAHVLEKTLLNDVYATAADTSGDGKISLTDFIQVKSKILGKGDITAR